MVRSSLLRLAVGVPVLLAASASGQEGEEAAFDRTPQDCVIVSNIDQIDAVDDQTVIFYMRGKRAYRNQLPRRCPGLERENRIAYETRTSRLCSVDTVTVLEQFGASLRPGFTCRLGEFVPMSPADIEELEMLKKGDGRHRAIETREVELNSGEDESGADTEPAEGEAEPAAKEN